jgi:hypothetical protein
MSRNPIPILLLGLLCEDEADQLLLHSLPTHPQ